MKLKEIQRTATFAWSPRPDVPLLVSGSAAGAIDPEYSSSTRLELWHLDLTDRSSAAHMLSQPTAFLDTESSFYDLDFSADGYHVAGALENGNVELWSVESGPQSQLRHLYSGRHPNGAAHVVKFNRQQPRQLASGGANGQILIWNLDRMQEPTAPSTQSSRPDDVTDLAWNKRVAHILASTGRTGFTSIWDLNKRREVLHLHYTSPAGQRLPVSSVAWHPSNSTKLATASIDDNQPVILTWDLRNASVPEKVIQGHTSGVLSLDWCDYDEHLLLSSGRDNRTLLWDPVEGTMLGEYPVSVGWAFKTRFHPHLPDLFATSTLDTQIVVQSLQDTGTAPDSAAAAPSANPASADDFWNSDVVMDSVHPRFTLQHAPSWLQRPVSAKFGFGNRLAVVRNNNVSIDRVTDDSIGDDTQKFFAALQSGDLESLLTSREGADWLVLSQLVGAGSAKDVLEVYAGKDEDEPEDSEEFNITPQVYEPAHEFRLLDGAHDRVTKLVLGGSLEKAVDQLISAGEASDALLVASFANSPELLARAQAALLSAEADEKPYLRAAWAVAGNHVVPLAELAELDAWPHTLRAILASQNDIAKTTKVLGDRLLAAGKRDDAVLVYLIGANVSAAASVWLDELPALQRKYAVDNTAYAAHVKSLQQVIEKITVAQRATKTAAAGSGDSAQDDKLHDAFREYAQIASSQGEPQLAKMFLDMVPGAQPAPTTTRSAPGTGLQSRLSTPQTAPKSPYRPYGKRPANATLPLTTPQAPAVVTPATARPSRPAPVNPYGNPYAASRLGQDNISSPTQPLAPVPPPAVSSNPYAQAPTNPYAQAPTNPYGQPAAPFSQPTAPVPAAPLAPPPKAGTAAASIAASANGAAEQSLPPSAAHRPPAHGWNDLPELAKAARRTPVAPQIIQPNYAVANPTTLPPSGPGAPATGPAAAAPPPPKVGTNPRRSSSSANGVTNAAAAAPPPVQQVPIPAPNSLPAMLGGSPSPGAPGSQPAPPAQPTPPARRVSNPYAPPPQSAAAAAAPASFAPPQAQPLRPPSAKPNPYAVPAPSAAAPAMPTPSVPSLGIPPPTAQTPTYGSRYGAPPASAVPATPAPTAATVTPAAVPTPAPPPGPARTQQAPNPAGTSAAAAAVLDNSAPTAAATPRYPAGDREHIPAHTQPVYNTLSGELARVKPAIFAQYPKQYKDTARRLDILFDLLNNDNVLDGEAVSLLTSMTSALQNKDFEAARAAQVELHATKSEQCGQWMTGVKRLIDMAAAIPA